MIGETLNALCAAGGHFELAAQLGDRLFQVSRLGWQPQADGVRIEIEAALDQKALELGRTVIGDRIRLDLDAEGRPRRFERASGEQRLTIDFADGEARATLADGSAFTVPGTPDAVLDGNAPALTAVLLQLLVARHGDAAGRCAVFLAGQLLPVSYALTREADGRLRSSLEELIAVDSEGVLESLVMEQQALTVRRAATEEMALLGRVETAPRKAAAAAAAPEGLDTREFEVPRADGTVTALARRPKNAAPRGAVLLLPGSGRIDRHGRAGNIDTGIGALADALAKAGFATLTADQPGAGNSKLGAAALTSRFSDEVAAAGDLLEATQALLPTARVAIIGHSLGGLVSLALASQRPKAIAALALLAAPGRPIDQLMDDQILWLGRERGLSEAEIDRQLTEQRGLVEAIRTVPEWTADTVPERYLAQRRLRDWMIELLDIDPAKLIAALPCPVFVGQGENDLQVGVEADFARLAVARADIDSHLYPGVGHLLRPTTRAEGLAAYAEDRPLSAALVADLIAFLGAHLASR
ncbi:alpha/beta hydrolase family protein [Polymorphobacter sp.]|uniref:alpha/beta hydrolase family protein n=1 Tax=Polymorphobacter sp. TaxID=1909290 RepID=UPI003F6FFF2C